MLNTLGYTNYILEHNEFHANSDKGTSLFSNVPPDYKNWRNKKIRGLLFSMQ